MKREYEVSGIHCAACAAKLDNGIHNLAGAGEVPEEHGIPKALVLLYIAGAIVWVTGFFLVEARPAKLILFILAYIIFGFKVLKKSLLNLLNGKVFDENFLMSIASLGAFVIGEYPEGAAVMMFYQIGELLQDYAVDNSRKAIKSLLSIRPDYANLKTARGFERVDPSKIKPGELIVVRPGERVPLDGIVEAGESALDTSALTGESLPRDVNEGSEILSGSINLSGVLYIRVTKVFGESAVNRILSLVENASQKKAGTERIMSRLAKWYTPAVVVLAVLLAIIPPVFFNGDLSQWFYRAMIFLVLSCPCALVISIPLGFFGGIGAASRRSILVKGGNHLEELARISTVVFDKTGTLTKGEFEVTDVLPFSGISKEELLYFAAYGEAYSTHPLARPVIKAYGRAIDKSLVSEYREYAGMGVSAKISGKSVLCGNSRLFDKLNIRLENPLREDTAIHVAIDGSYAGSIRLEDAVRRDAHKAIESLRGLGVSNIAMLTGDRKAAAENTARRLGIDNVYAELLPHEKVEALEFIMDRNQGKGSVAFVGDGINDSPVIARADLGIAMGGAGSDAAIEAADIVMMTDEPCKVAEAIALARKTKTVVFQNIFLAISVKTLVLAMGAGGTATLWEAVFADVGVALLAIMNAMRLVRTGKKAGFAGRRSGV